MLTRVCKGANGLTQVDRSANSFTEAYIASKDVNGCYSFTMVEGVATSFEGVFRLVFMCLATFFKSFSNDVKKRFQKKKKTIKKF